MCRMAPDGAARGGREDSRDCSRDAPCNCDEHTPNSCLPAADVRAVASFVCARAHRASALSRSSGRSRSIVRAAVAAGWYSRWPTDRRGIGAPRSAFHATRQSVPKIQRGASQLERARWAQQTQNGPPSVASRKYEPPVRCPARGASRLPFPLSITPTSFNATRRPRLGKPRVVAHCRLARPDATAVFLHP